MKNNLPSDVSLVIPVAQLHIFVSFFLGWTKLFLLVKKSGVEKIYHLTLFFQFSSYPLAINFQEKVVEGWEGHGPSAQDELNEAVRVLEQLKEKASTAVAEALLNALPLPDDEEPGSAKNSQSASSPMER